jgi:hypothetical membrane protein
VHPSRLRGGALAWLLTLQFFVVETVAQLQVDGPYSRADDVISALGTADSPAHFWMNASFVLQGVLIAAGVLLLRPLLTRGAGAAATVLLSAAALGVLLVGLFPSDGNAGLHAFGAVLHLLGGGLGLIALAYTLRPRSEALGTTLALLGLVGTAMTVFFLTEVTEYLGRGGTERAAAYVVPIGLALAGAALWRMRTPDAATPTDDTRSARQAERERTRAERAERERARDAALEAAARAAEQRRAERPADPEDDGEDPWAPAPRRGG